MSAIPAHILLPPNEMAQADAAAAASGIPSFDLMVRAGHAVAATALKRFPAALRFVVFCGPGNNGGDGYVAASALAASGVAVAVFAAGDPTVLRGDAKLAFEKWGGQPIALDEFRPRSGDVVIDALFGAGLSRDLPENIQKIIAQVNEASLPVLAVDLPSGICGLTGRPRGGAFRADCSVTFMARKPGHLLLPGKSLCGDVEVFDIGIPARIVLAAAGHIHENRPELWCGFLPVAGADSHKYKRGHLGVFSGHAASTGAARLSALAGLKTGAGLVTVASPEDAMAINADHLTAIMLRQVGGLDDLDAWLDTAKPSAFVLGPAFSIGKRAREFTLALSDHPLVLDADGITSFRDDPQTLFDAFSSGQPHLIMTPHEGEFGRLFPDLAADPNLGKVEKAQKAAERAHAVIVYKGADTVIAAPDGRANINSNGPASLATAGSGDVLAGMIGALLAQGMSAFEAACAGVYLHAEAAHLAGPGLTAEDLAGQAGKAMANLVDPASS